MFKWVLGLGLVSSLVLLLLNIVPMFMKDDVVEFMDGSHVEGVALIYGEKLWTLNFDQQKRVLEILNRSVPIGQVPTTPTSLKGLVIYLSGGTSIEIKLIGTSKGNLVFEIPSQQAGFLEELSHGELFDILSNAYDKNHSERALP